jgi:hypothetical protein
MTDFWKDGHNGFLVVRLPEMNFDARGRGAYSNRAPKLGATYYGGVFRMPWFDLDEDYYAARLPADLAGARKTLTNENADFTGIEICRERKLAEQILGYCNRESRRNELIAIASQALGEIKDVTIPQDIAIEWIGFDVVALGHWSLLEDGLFVAPSYFARWHEEFNHNGLFDSPDHVEEFAMNYRSAAAKGGVEELPPEVYGVAAIRIGRVAAPG